MSFCCFVYSCFAIRTSRFSGWRWSASSHTKTPASNRISKKPPLENHRLCCSNVTLNRVDVAVLPLGLDKMLRSGSDGQTVLLDQM